MKVSFQYGIKELALNFPEESIVYRSVYRSSAAGASDLLMDSLMNPVSGKTLKRLIENRREGNAIIVVSDITRPVPYKEFLPDLVLYVESAGIKREEIILLVATGMHRPTTPDENLKMFGEFIVKNYRIINHNSTDEEQLAELEGRSWSGAKVRINRHYLQAGFRIATGLVEPHFMAGFSGGRKAICPGLVSLDAIQNFHGYKFLSSPFAASSIMDDNPCNMESSGVARLCPPDYAVNIVLDNNKMANAIFSGELFSSHQKAVEYVKEASCPVAGVRADLAVTSSGGYPLDTTFYQCVKGFVNCLPAVKNNGGIIAFGSCTDGIGSEEYSALMRKYSGNYKQFIEDIKGEDYFIKDQWEFQMHIKAIEKTGIQNLNFFTSNIKLSDLSMLSVNPHYCDESDIESCIQDSIDMAVWNRKRIAVFPEGPYCSPIPSEEE